MKYQIWKAKDTNIVEQKYTGIDGTVNKTKLNIFEDGNDEEYLKLIKEFQNHVSTYEIWNDEHAAYIVYKNFRKCLAGATCDLWDQIMENAEEERDELTFQTQLSELTTTVLGNDALHNQKEYLKSTPKPENMSVKQWINRLKNINSYLPLMEQDGQAYSEADLISEVITKNIPSAWTKDYRLAELHLKRNLRDIISKLIVIEENVKTHPNPNKEKQNKQLKNPCRLHNGTHEWNECRQNPKNQKNEEKTMNTTDNNRSRNGNGNRQREENRCTETTQDRNRRRSRSNSSRSSSEHKFHCIKARKESVTGAMNKTPSSEILIAIPNKKCSKKYTTYLGLVDSGSSGS